MAAAVDRVVILSASPIHVAFWFQVEVRVRWFAHSVPVGDNYPSGFRPNQVSPNHLDRAISLRKGLNPQFRVGICDLVQFLRACNLLSKV